MNIRSNTYLSAVVVVLLAGIYGCKKESTLSIPPVQPTFAGVSQATYQVVAPNTSYFVKVGQTTVLNQDRSYTVSVSSPTGAQAGNQFTITNTTVTIKAGKALDSIEVKGNFNAYTSGRKDTLVFTITEAGKEAGFNSTFRLALRGPCFEGDVDLNLLRGDYKNTNEDFGGPYGPYTTSITNVEQTSATTGTITVANVFDYGWNPIKVKLDWTNPTARTALVDNQTGIGNAGTISGTYNGMDIQVRQLAGQPGTFSICNQTITIKMNLGVTGLGFFGTPYILEMKR